LPEPEGGHGNDHAFPSVCADYELFRQQVNIVQQRLERYRLVNSLCRLCANIFEITHSLPLLPQPRQQPVKFGAHAHVVDRFEKGYDSFKASDMGGE
jgi:hypothetical protein